MKNKIIIAVLAILMAGMYSCRKLHDWNQPKDPEVEYSAIYPLAGEWYVLNMYEDANNVIDDHYHIGHTKLYTYNTAAEDVDKMWVNDDGEFWDYRLKVNCNKDNLSFGNGNTGADSIDNVAYDVKVLLYDGKVMEDAGTSPSGVMTDSIYFKVVFGDDPGATEYIIAGIRRTGFLEDDH